MFKTYLRIQPPGVQLAVFLFIWSGMYLIFNFVQPPVIKALFSISPEGLPDFFSKEAFHHPDFLRLLNAGYAVVVFFLPAFLFAYLAHPTPFRYLGMMQPQKRTQWLWVIVMALGMLPVLTALGGLIKELNLGEQAQAMDEARESMINTYLTGTHFSDLLRNLLFLALLPAVCEEIFFRGAVQKFAFSFFKKTGPAIFTSGLLFAVMHFSLYEFVPILLAGILLAWVYQATGCLWMNILLHFLHNGLQVILPFYANRTPWLNHLAEDNRVVGGVILAGALLLAAGIRKLYTLRTPLPASWSVYEPQQTDLNQN